MEDSPFVRSLPWLLFVAVTVAVFWEPAVGFLSRLGLLQF